MDLFEPRCWIFGDEDAGGVGVDVRNFFRGRGEDVCAVFTSCKFRRIQGLDCAFDISCRSVGDRGTIARDVMRDAGESTLSLDSKL